ncbi:class II lanthipeptide, LchA2/BrtA2 family [Paenibacillus sp. TC-CSREp1]|uniref:class II lanthipeptide, LchA2/BrtA2 family n=1 Tax=Paenibacillus sp. TC-CSREp1 TaxID=3410089 RepID=UPI003D034E8D
MKALEMIGEINEQELMELSGATEVQAASSWPCAIVPPVLIWTITDSANSCPSTACSSRC